MLPLRCLHIVIGDDSRIGTHWQSTHGRLNRLLTALRTSNPLSGILMRTLSKDELNDTDDGDIYSNEYYDSFHIDAIEINGTSDGLIVSRLYYVPIQGFNNDDDSQSMLSIPQLFSPQDIQRLNLTPANVTLPVALMLLDPITYPTQSRARKAIRKRSICFSPSSNNNYAVNNSHDLLSNMQFRVGKVLSRIYPGDVIGFQRRIGNDYYAIQGVPYRAPPFDVPVIFEDDHMAIVNKPPGVVLYREGEVVERKVGAMGGIHYFRHCHLFSRHQTLWMPD
ncbi:hypothetical protein ACHAWX_002109 [Stephanocyclus meneghinianus]